MKKIFNISRNIFGFGLGLYIGGMINMLIINNGGQFIALPEGINPNDIESIKENIHLYQPIHFLIPFLAHAVGTFIGAFITSLIAVNIRMYLSIGIGFCFLVGGIMMVLMLPSPLWFNIIDLSAAYLPMAWLGWKLSNKIITQN